MRRIGIDPIPIAAHDAGRLRANYFLPESDWLPGPACYNTSIPVLCSVRESAYFAFPEGLTITATCPVDAESFGKRLRQLRLAAGMTRAELADAADVKVRTIEAWEQGRGEPLVSSVLKLAAGLRVKAAELLIDPPDDLPEPTRGRPPKQPPPPDPRRRGGKAKE